MLGDLNERVTRSKVTSIAVFAHSAFVASFEPKDVGHALSDSNGSMPCMRNLKILKGIRFGFWLSLRLLVTPLEPNVFSRTRKVKIVGSAE